MIHLKNTQGSGPARLAISESVKTGAENNVLPHARNDGIMKTVLRKSTAKDHMGAEGGSAGILQPFQIGLRSLQDLAVEEQGNNWIIQNFG